MGGNSGKKKVFYTENKTMKRGWSMNFSRGERNFQNINSCIKPQRGGQTFFVWSMTKLLYTKKKYSKCAEIQISPSLVLYVLIQTPQHISNYLGKIFCHSHLCSWEN